MFLKKKQLGFSLLELMVAVAIIGIILAFMLPSFQAQSIKAKRSDGQTKLMEIQGFMERYAYDNNTYPNKLSLLSAYTTDEILSDEEHYKLSVNAPDSNCPITSCYVLKAVPQGGQASDGDLLLYSNGKKEGNW